jgi:Tol biopolymer transport system component
VGPLELITRGAPPSDTGNGYDHAFSSDGRYVVFVSDVANLVPGQVDPGESSDVFLHDRETGTTTLVSRSAASPVTAGNAHSSHPVISADGRFVAFESDATDLVAGLVVPDPCCGNVFLYDRATGEMTLVSRVPGSPVTAGNGGSANPAISADGAYVAFTSSATDLVAGQVDARSTSDVFLYDRVTGTTILGSRTAASAVTTGNGTSSSPVLSADGTLGLFNSVAGNLVSDDHNGLVDVFAFTRCPLKSSRTPGVLCREVSGGPGRSAPPRGAGGVGSR